MLLWSSAFSRAGDGYDTNVDRILLAYAAGFTAAVGLGVGISGVIVLLRQSEAENRALAQYQRPFVPPPLSAAPRGRTLRVPLLSLSF